jgi:hypothetical protein
MYDEINATEVAVLPEAAGQELPQVIADPAPVPTEIPVLVPVTEPAPLPVPPVAETPAEEQALPTVSAAPVPETATQIPIPTTLSAPVLQSVPPKEESVFRPMEELPDNSKGIADLAELRRLEVLRTEFASSTFKPKVILSYETISFNKACVDLMPETRYVNVLIDRVKQRIIILPVNRHAKDALKWCGVSPKGDVKRRVCTARKFGEKLYEMMAWVKENKYRILAYYQQIQGVELLVFNLRECEMVVPEYITTKTGKVMKRGKVYLPGAEGFGLPLEVHSKANEVELDAHYTLSDKDVDVTISDVKVKGKMPNDEEIIMSQYRKEKPQEVYANAQ